jgi:hypothetical protein
MGRNENNVLEKIPIGSRFDSHRFGFVPNRAKPSEGERSDCIVRCNPGEGLFASSSVWRIPSPAAHLTMRVSNRRHR